MKKFREWLSIKTVKAPDIMVLLCIFAANILIIGLSGLIISSLAPESLENNGFWSSVFNTITMVLGIGGVETVVEDISQANAFYVICCLILVIIGMIVFTGAIIGYMTEIISSFIENADSSSRRLHVSNHIVILNWNNRAPEIINELLYKNKREKVVVLVPDNKDEILSDIDERLSDTIEAENETLAASASNLNYFKRRKYLRNNKISNKLTVIVREGDCCSHKQLNDISLKHAKSIIILNNEMPMASGSLSNDSLTDSIGRGNAHTVKTLVQVAHITAADDSADDQKIVVEIEDDWTLSLVNSIIEHKTRKGKCNIVPISVNKILGQIFSQFSIMPELNMVYSTLFSNKDAAFYVLPSPERQISESVFISEYLDNHLCSVPLTIMEDGDSQKYSYYMAGSESHIGVIGGFASSKTSNISVKKDFAYKDKHVMILGHNSKSSAIMDGFSSFLEEWGNNEEPGKVLDITIIDNGESLKKHDYYKQYPCVGKILSADIYEKDLILGEIDRFIEENNGERCIMILSNDAVSKEDIDADALAYLILVQDIFYRKSAEGPGFVPDKIDMIVEILDPKNYDIVRNYSINNIVISNRYISKMILQIAEKEALFNFYSDILLYDDPDTPEIDSKEIYIKKTSDFFEELPEPCTAAELIRSVFRSSPDDNKSIVLGYFPSGGNMVLFEGDQSEINVSLTKNDKLVIFSNH